MADLTAVLQDALKLSLEDRAALAERLLASLDDLSEEEADRVWGEEAQRRLAEFRSGRAAGIPAANVAAKAQKLFR